MERELVSIFLYQKLKEILIRYSRIILTASKVRLISIIWRYFIDSEPKEEVISRTSNIAFLMDWAQISDLDFGLIRQNTSIKKASFHYQGWPLSLKSGKLWLNSYVYWISITSNWFYSQQFSLPYSKNILSVCPFRGDKKKKKKVLVNPTEFFH